MCVDESPLPEPMFGRMVDGAVLHGRRSASMRTRARVHACSRHSDPTHLCAAATRPRLVCARVPLCSDAKESLKIPPENVRKTRSNFTPWWLCLDQSYAPIMSPSALGASVKPGRSFSLVAEARRAYRKTAAYRAYLEKRKSSLCVRERESEILERDSLRDIFKTLFVQ